MCETRFYGRKPDPGVIHHHRRYYRYLLFFIACHLLRRSWGEIPILFIFTLCLHLRAAYYHYVGIHVPIKYRRKEAGADLPTCQGVTCAMLVASLLAAGVGCCRWRRDNGGRRPSPSRRSNFLINFTCYITMVRNNDVILQVFVSIIRSGIFGDSFIICLVAFLSI